MKENNFPNWESDPLTFLEDMSYLDHFPLIFILFGM